MEIDTKKELFNYLMEQHLPYLTDIGAYARELSMLNESISQLFLQGLRSSRSLAAQIMVLDDDAEGFNERISRVSRVEGIYGVGEYGTT